MSNTNDSAPDLVAFWENDVKPRLRAEHIYGNVVFARREGRYWRGKCPLHGGDDSNFSVDSQTLRWTCFSQCGNGSVLAFLNGGSEPRGAQWVESVRKLANEAGVPFPSRQFSPAEMQRAQEKERRAGILEAFWQLAQRMLLAPALPGSPGQRAHDYLTKTRDFADTQLDVFGLCPSLATISHELRAAGFSEEEITASGLLRDSRWENRVLVAWRNHRGEIGTFTARDLSSNGTSDSKYLYLSTQNGWAQPKSDLLLFGLDTALPVAHRVGLLLIVEGIFDALSLHARGFLNVAAIGGGGQELSRARLQKLATLGISHIALLLDNDRGNDGKGPGLAGTVAVVENIRNTENVPIVDVIHPVTMGEFKDPDAFVRSRGIEALRALLNERESAVLFQARLLLDGITPRSSHAQRRLAVDAVLHLDRSLQGARAALDREDVLQLTARFTGYSYETLAALAEDWATRQAREHLEKQVDTALRDAQKQRAAREPALRVLEALSGEVAALRALSIEAPPAFSVERLERESTVVPTGKRSGWASLDKLDVRFNAGELAVLGARTGHGKTSALVSLLLNWLRPLADAPGDEVLVLYSAEEPELRIYHRLLAMLTANGNEGWTVSQIRDYLRSPYSRGSDYLWPGPEQLKEARALLQSVQCHLLVVYRPTWTIDDIDAHARALHKRHPIGAIMVDYLQRVPPPPGRFDRRDQEVSAIGRRLKTLSVDLATPVVTGAQINREAIPEGYARSMNNASYESAKDTILKARPELHHLREGGSEQEADLILGLLNYAADYRGIEKLKASTLLEVGTLKNRYGEAGKWARLAFEGRYGCVREARAGEVL